MRTLAVLVTLALLAAPAASAALPDPQEVVGELQDNIQYCFSILIGDDPVDTLLAVAKATLCVVGRTV